MGPKLVCEWRADLEQLGVFLCMRCAAIHRKLGTHISKVKSLSMDTWTNEQVEVGTHCSLHMCLPLPPPPPFGHQSDSVSARRT